MPNSSLFLRTPGHSWRASLWGERCRATAGCFKTFLHTAQSHLAAIRLGLQRRQWRCNHAMVTQMMQQFFLDLFMQLGQSMHLCKKTTVQDWHGEPVR